MNWESSKALTPLKRDFLRLLFERDQTFFLTGGSALGIFYLEHRLSYDLDFFTTEETVDWHLLENVVLEIAATIAAEVRTITASPTFRRVQLTRGQEQEMVDFVVERVPQIDDEKELFGNIRVDTLREIAVNKVTTLISRCELKDLIGLYFLRGAGYEVVGLFGEAQKKEGGLEPAMISFLLSQVSVECPPDYLIAPLDLDELRQFVADLQTTMGESSFPT